MLKCTRIRCVDAGAAPFYWSEVLSLRVELAFDASGSSDADKLALQLAHGGATPSEAWAVAAAKISLAAVTRTSCVAAAPGGATATPRPTSLEAPTAATAKHASTSTQAVAVAPGGTADSPVATFTLQLPIPYCAAASRAPTPAPSAAAAPGAAAASPASGGAGAPVERIICEWEVTLSAPQRIGAMCAALEFVAPIAVLRHAVPVSTAVVVTSRAVSCHAASAAASSLPHSAMLAGVGGGGGGGGGAGASAASSTAGAAAPRHCLVAVSCRNACGNHVVVRHVELATPHWAQALLPAGPHNYKSTSDKAEQLQQQVVGVANPWVVRRHDQSGGVAHVGSGNGNGAGGGGSAAGRAAAGDGAGGSATTDPITAALFHAVSSAEEANERRHGGATDPQSASANTAAAGPTQRLVTLSDSLPVTLKPLESYTFCFECAGWAEAHMRDAVALFVARTTISGRPVLVNHPIHV